MTLYISYLETFQDENFIRLHDHVFKEMVGYISFNSTMGGNVTLIYPLWFTRITFP